MNLVQNRLEEDPEVETSPRTSEISHNLNLVKQKVTSKKDLPYILLGSIVSRVGDEIELLRCPASHCMVTRKSNNYNIARVMLMVANEKISPPSILVWPLVDCGAFYFQMCKTVTITNQIYRP